METEIGNTTYSCELEKGSLTSYYYLVFKIEGTFPITLGYYSLSSKEEGEEILADFEDDICNFYYFLLAEIMPSAVA